MKTFEITKQRMEEITCCIVDNGMDRDEACDYAISVLNECRLDEAEVVEDVERDEIMGR